MQSQLENSKIIYPQDQTYHANRPSMLLLITIDGSSGKKQGVHKYLSTLRTIVKNIDLYLNQIKLHMYDCFYEVISASGPLPTTIAPKKGGSGRGRTREYSNTDTLTVE